MSRDPFEAYNRAVDSARAGNPHKPAFEPEREPWHPDPELEAEAEEFLGPLSAYDACEAENMLADLRKHAERLDDATLRERYRQLADRVSARIACQIESNRNP